MLVLTLLPWGTPAVAQEPPESEVRIEQVPARASEVGSAVVDRSPLPGGRVGTAVAVGLDGRAGSGNTAVVEQRGAAHRASIRQIGRGNVAAVLEAGGGHRVEVLQVGDENVVGAWLHGVDDALSVEQRGDGNTYLLRFEGASLRHRVVQEGTGLVAVQLGLGRVPLGVEQRGSGAAVRITHGRPGPGGSR